MNYQKVYNEIIERAKSRTLEGYKENHHILPKCMGGGDEPENIVELTAREHFIVHKLLVDIYPDELKLKYAVRFMSLLTSVLDRNYIVGAREYERLKSIHSHSEETKAKIGDANRGRIFTKEQKKSFIGRGTGRTIGPMSEEHKRKIGKDNSRPQKKLTCPHCGKIGGTSMNRWHFDNCKQK